MITLEDCAAFCDADPQRIQELACRDALPLINAYALAHMEARGIAAQAVLPANSPPPEYRLAA